MGVECYRSKDAALNWKDEAFLTPCIDLSDESVEIPIGDLVIDLLMKTHSKWVWNVIDQKMPH